MKRGFLVSAGGFCLIVVGFMTYMPVSPLRFGSDIPGIIILALGVVIALAGVQRGLKQGKSKPAKLGLGAFGLLSVALAIFSVYWVTIFSADLPEPPPLLVKTESIQFEATDVTGKDVGSIALAGKPYVLVFYRGDL